jgi:hypothetical protein
LRSLDRDRAIVLVVSHSKAVQKVLKIWAMPIEQGECTSDRSECLY